MLAMIRSEFRKLSTVRGPWLLLAAGPLLVVAGISGLAESGRNLASPATQVKAFGHVGLAALVTLVFGMLAVAGEYRQGSIADTFLSFPRRGRILATKLGVYALAGAAAGLAAAVTAIITTATWCAARNVPFHLWNAGSWRTLAGGVAVNIAFAVIGTGLGALVRNLAVAVALALAWIAVIEGIAGQLLGAGLARWLPFSASEALGRASLFGAGRPLPQWGGGLVLLGYSAVFAAAAVLSTLGRDVT
jgi:ABC-2 type transport system permease protein